MQPNLRPLLRGHFHQAAFFVALGACAMLLAKATGTKGFLPVLIYTLSLCGLLGVSSLYHRVTWKDRSRRWMRRLDHAFIFLLIAGTGTPIGFFALPEEKSKEFLFIVWISAIVGVSQALFWVKKANWISAVLYLFVGWMIVPYLPELGAALGSPGALWLWLGGLIYTLGAIVFAIRRPNPLPKTFGYHEIFHILVIVAAAFHFLAVYSIVR